MTHDSLCPLVQPAADDSSWCFCPRLRAARADERNQLLARIDELHPICAEPSVTFTRQGCTCANGIATVRAIIEESA